MKRCPAGQYLTAGILSDHQQRAMPFIGNSSAMSFPKHWEERTYLLSWVDPGEIPIHMQEGERVRRFGPARCSAGI